MSDHPPLAVRRLREEAVALREMAAKISLRRDAETLHRMADGYDAEAARIEAQHTPLRATGTPGT